jgi:hypothetical protein
MNFHQFKEAVALQFQWMSLYPLYTTSVEKDELWATYLSSFPEGTNPIFRERTEHDCSCCRQFIRAVGNVVAIIDGELVSIWDFDKHIDSAYQTVANAMSLLVKSAPIDNIFLTTERTAGTYKTFEQLVDGVHTWNHFFVSIPKSYTVKASQIGPKRSEARSTFDVFRRGLKEITPEAVDTVLELIGQNSLYRGEEHKHTLQEFKKLQAGFDGSDEYVWSRLFTVSPVISRIRNSAIGTLLQDLSEDMGLEEAVKRFESVVAPANYKRPTALVTQSMVRKAKETIQELGLTSALERRHVTLADINVNDVFFISRGNQVRSDDPFDAVSGSVPVRSLPRVEEVSIDKFISEVLPLATSVEVLMENRHAPNLVSLIGPSDPTALPLFKWSNNFSWSYQGNMTDSIKERVKAAGGNVEGELCCRLAWEYSDDLDLHLTEPDGYRIYFSNRRIRSPRGGQLDVDANGMDGIREHPVENIYYPQISRLSRGIYALSVNNYSRRSDGVGFEVEIDLMGNVTSLEYDRVVRTGETVVVATMASDGAGKVVITPRIPSTTRSKEFWGVRTQVFREVSCILPSPNFWAGQEVGNRHFLFMLKGCRTDEVSRGFYNEFLRSDLNAHRKVLEMVGSKVKVEDSEHQLSGLGFSSTQRNSLTCRVTGNFTRTIKVLF